MALLFSLGFRDAIHAAWGKPRAVVEAAQNELFRQIDVLDVRDQVRWGVNLGILAGQTEKDNPEKFIDGFKGLLTAENE